MESLRALVPIIGGVSLVAGTGSAMGIAAIRRRERSIEKTTNSQDELPPASKDVEGDSLAEEDISVSDSDEAASKPLLFPTVSSTTKECRSLPYNLFVASALIHGICLIVTSAWLRDLLLEGEADDKETIGILVFAGGLIGALSIILTSIIPAKGRTISIHVTLGAIFVGISLAWMVWVIILGKQLTSDGTLLLFVIRIALASLTLIVTIWTAIYKWRMKQSFDGDDELFTKDWYEAMHRLALGQMAFGSGYALFFMTTAYELLSG